MAFRSLRTDHLGTLGRQSRVATSVKQGIGHVCLPHLGLPGMRDTFTNEGMGRHRCGRIWVWDCRGIKAKLADDLLPKPTGSSSWLRLVGDGVSSEISSRSARNAETGAKRGEVSRRKHGQSGVTLLENRNLMSLTKSACGRLLIHVLPGLAAIGAFAQSSFTPHEGEYSLSRGKPGDQMNASLALSSSGGYVAWEDNATDGNGLGVTVRAINNYLSPVEVKTFRVNQNSPLTNRLARG